MPKSVSPLGLVSSGAGAGGPPQKNELTAARRMSIDLTAEKAPGSAL
jgi:hypothetical protein